MTDATVRTPAPDSGPRRPALAGLLASNQVGLALVIVLFAAVFTVATPGFGSPFNLYALGRSVAIDIMIGFSMMVVMATGGMNLAVGSIGVSAVMAASWLMESHGLPVAPAVVLCLAFGAVLGGANGLLVVRTGVSSFVITLATMSLFFGAMIVLTRAEPIRDLPAALIDFGKLRLFGFVSALVLLALAVGVLLVWLFRFTALGRKILAAGANPRAARLSGVPVDRVIVVCHALSGALAALAGLMLTMRNGAALPAMAGQIGMDWLLPAFLAPVLGGTLLGGGAVSVIGTLLGALMVGVIENGLLLLQVGEFWVQFFLGMILLAAVLLDRARSLYAERRRVYRP